MFVRIDRRTLKFFISNLLLGLISTVSSMRTSNTLRSGMHQCNNKANTSPVVGYRTLGLDSEGGKSASIAGIILALTFSTGIFNTNSHNATVPTHLKAKTKNSHDVSDSKVSDDESNMRKSRIPVVAALAASKKMQRINSFTHFNYLNIPPISSLTSIPSAVTSFVTSAVTSADSSRDISPFTRIDHSKFDFLCQPHKIEEKSAVEVSVPANKPRYSANMKVFKKLERFVTLNLDDPLNKRLYFEPSTGSAALLLAIRHGLFISAFGILAEGAPAYVQFPDSELIDAEDFIAQIVEFMPNECEETDDNKIPVELIAAIYKCASLKPENLKKAISVASRTGKLVVLEHLVNLDEFVPQIYFDSSNYPFLRVKKNFTDDVGSSG